MINIGIEKNQGLVYEGSSNYGRAVWPTPVVTPAKFVFPSEEDIKAESSSNVFGYRFREDSFDPISRVRRGRFYLANQSQPKEWYVQPHPAMSLPLLIYGGIAGGSDVAFCVYQGLILRICLLRRDVFLCGRFIYKTLKFL